MEKLEYDLLNKINFFIRYKNICKRQNHKKFTLNNQYVDDNLRKFGKKLYFNEKNQTITIKETKQDIDFNLVICFNENITVNLNIFDTIIGYSIIEGTFMDLLEDMNHYSGNIPLNIDLPKYNEHSLRFSFLEIIKIFDDFKKKLFKV